MIKTLQSINGVNVNAQYRAKAEIKRGAFVKEDVSKGELEIATATADFTGVAVRDVVVSDDVAMGVPVSEWDPSQDTIKAGELCGYRVLLSGERFATTEYSKDTSAKLSEEEAKAGKYLAIENGVLIKSEGNVATKIVSLGFMQIAGHKMLGYKIV